jgi:hypothetical protein
MGPHSFRPTIFGGRAHRRRISKFAGLRFETLEGRIAPALFNVLDPGSISGLNNNGCVAVADFNKDGFADAVLTNFGTDYTTGAGTTITILRNNQAGGFTRSSPATGGTNAAFVAVGDLNGDTWPDFVVCNANGQNTGSVSVFANNGAGTLTRVGNPFSAFGNNAAWVGLADFTGDGILDVAVASFGKEEGEGITGNNMTIFSGNDDGTGHGNFTFSSTPIATLAPRVQFIPTAAAIADFNGDGHQDIAATVPGVPPDFGNPYPPGSVYLFQGTGLGGFEDPTEFETGGVLPINIQAAYVNSDSKLDLVIANGGDPNGSPEWKDKAIGVLLNVSSASVVTFDSPTTITANTMGPFAVSVTDFDMDGKTDIAAVNYGSQGGSPPSSVSVYIGNGSGTSFTPGTPASYQTYFLPGGQYLAAGDFDANGTPDLIVAHATNVVRILDNQSVPAPTVTINQGASQADPTNGASIVYDVVFSEGMTGFTDSDVDLSGSSVGGLSVQVTAISSTQYTVTVTGMTGTGTVRATIPAGRATSIAGSLANLASTSTDNQVAFDLAAPTVTINQAAGQADPATSGPILYTVVFSENVTGFGNNDIDLTSSSFAGLSASVTQNSPKNYTVSVTGMVGNGTVVAKVFANAAIDGVGNPSAASTSSDNTVTFGLPQQPTVTINQGSSQLDPTNGSSIVFDVVFSAGVTGFTGTDVDLSGSSVGGLSASVTPVSSTVYTVSVTGMAGTGFVRATIPAGVATSISGGLTNVASTSSDNQVNFDLVGPTVTINQAAGQLDPVNSGPVLFTVVFSDNVTGFGNGDIDLTGSSLPGLSATVSENTPSNYTVSVIGMVGSGTVVAKVVPGAAFDGVGNPSAASTSTDNTVTFDSIRPSVTINQAVAPPQPDPTNISSIAFDVKFTEAVTGFGPADVSLLGSLAGGTLVVDVTGSFDTYKVTVTGMTTSGVVIASIPAGGASDAVGNSNFASTSTDNSVSFLNTGTIGFTQSLFYSQETPNTVTIKVTRAGQTDGDVSVDFVITDGTARRGGSANKGLKDYERKVDGLPVYTGTLSWLSGEGGEKEFKIDILDDTFNEGKELINLSLINPDGSPGLGLVSAALQIDPSDGQGPGSYLDQDGDKYTLKLNGRVGLLNYFRTDPDGTGRGPIELIQLTGTLPDPLRPRANLVITVVRTNTTNTPSDGMVGLGAITGPGLRSISARRANLDLEGINFDGYLGSLLIGNISNGADITTRATTNPLQKTRINALTIGDGTTINVENGIASLSATRIGVGAILAPSIGAMVVRGQVRPTIIIGDMASDITVSGTGVALGRPALGALIVNGSIPAGADIVAPSVGKVFIRKDLGADITISGANVDLTRRALASLRVLGTVAGSDIMVQGNVGAVAVGAFRDSRLYAGYVGPDVADPVGFNMAATVGSFRAIGKADGFQNSRVIATHINAVTITNLDSTNPQYFGFYADVRVGSLRVVGPDRFVFDPTISAPQGINEFEVMIV